MPASFILRLELLSQWSTFLSRCRIIQGGIESQAGDDADLEARRIGQFQCRETAVGGDYDGTLGDPAPDHQQQLPGTVGKFVWTSATLQVIAL